VAPEQLREWMAVSGSMKDLSRVQIDARLRCVAFVDVRDGETVEHVDNHLAIERPHRLAFHLAREAGGGEQHRFDRHRRARRRL
jgi:hypothetical protein